jgi:hypothetical protein
MGVVILEGKDCFLFLVYKKNNFFNHKNTHNAENFGS